MTNEEAANVLRIMASGIELKGYSDLWITNFKEAYELAYKTLEERPQGEWKLHGMIYYCSECGHECGESGDNFCGHCGADMRGGRE